MPRTTKLAIAISIVALAARFLWINQPFIDHWSWRQSDVAAIARNFLQTGFRFAWPQVDWAGDQPGYVGTEFPFLPFLAAACYKIFGVHEWIGRSQGVVFFALSLPFFYLLVLKIFNELAATWALFFYSFAPLNLMASRCFMPDVPSLSLSIIGLYLFVGWIEKKTPTLFLGSGLLISLSLLIKITSIVIVMPILYLAMAPLFERHVSKSFEAPRALLQLLVFAVIVLVPSAAWYWHAHRISEHFYPYHFFGSGGIQVENLGWYAKIARLTFVSSLTPILSILGLIGLVIATRGRFARLFHWWLVAMIAFIVIAGYGNRHPWYQLPLVPIFAALSGASCAVILERIVNWRGKIVFSMILAGCFGVSSAIQAQLLYEPAGAQFRNAGLALNKMMSPDALIVAADIGDPTILYYARRKGWHFPEKEGIWWGEPRDSEQLVSDFDDLRRRGATYLAITKNSFWWFDHFPVFVQHLQATSELIEAAPDFRIYKLQTDNK